MRNCIRWHSTKPNYNAIQYGLTVGKRRETFTEWYSQLLTKGQFVFDHDIAGFQILGSKCMFQWNLVRKFLNDQFHKQGVQEFYFPMVVREDNFKRESAHLAGFNSECIWAERFGKEPLSAPLGIRPTSETIVYPFLAQHLRTRKQLPIRLNQWCNVIRWEGRSSLPLIRSREFLWQEGHTAHGLKQEAQKECPKMLDIYQTLYKDLFAVPTIKGCKSKQETFAGAEYSLSLEALVPGAGRAVQACTVHHLGQNFSKIFNVCYVDENGVEQHVHQNCWGLSTRSIGISLMVHSDNQGIMQSPRIAPLQVLIVPCGVTSKAPALKEQIIRRCQECKDALTTLQVRADVDVERAQRGVGFAFHQQEFDGIPIRLEIGPTELRQHNFSLVKRNQPQQRRVLHNLDEIPAMLDSIHDELYNKAQQQMNECLVGPLETLNQIRECVEGGKFAKLFFCSSLECEQKLNQFFAGHSLKIITIVNDHEIEGGCLICHKATNELAIYGDSF